MPTPASHRTDRTQSLSARRNRGHSRGTVSRGIPAAAAPAGVETLEARQLMAASPLVVNGTDRGESLLITQTSTTVRVSRNGDTVASRRASDVSGVVVYARGGNDTVAADLTVKVPVTVYGGDGDDVIRGGPRADVLHGQYGDDRVYGGAGNDRIYGGGDDDKVEGGDGDDILVTIGGDDDEDAVSGNGGHDNFWVDAGGTDRMLDFSKSDAKHSVDSFMSYRIDTGDSFRTVKVPIELKGQSLADPVASSRADGWRDFSGNPLFASGGISDRDVDQNGASDCYFLAPLSSLARVMPRAITDRVVDFGEGSYGVHFERDGKSVFVRVDGDLPVNDTGSPFYASLGAQKSMWVAVLEKAWAFFRRSQGTYASTEFGKLSEAYRALGLGGVDTVRGDDFGSAGGLLEEVDDLLKEGHSVIYFTKKAMPTGAKVAGNHIVVVDRVVRDKSGKAVAVVLFDQRQTDFNKSADGKDDGYVTLTAREAVATLNCVGWCHL